MTRNCWALYDARLFLLLTAGDDGPPRRARLTFSRCKGARRWNRQPPGARERLCISMLSAGGILARTTMSLIRARCRADTGSTLPPATSCTATALWLQEHRDDLEGVTP